MEYKHIDGKLKIKNIIETVHQIKQYLGLHLNNV